MSKTIVYIGGFELPDKNAAAHRVLSNGKAFRKLGYNVVYIDASKEKNISNNILKTKKNYFGFDTYSVPYPNGAKAWLHYLTDIKSFVKVIEKQHEVCMVILYNFQAIAMRRMMSYCKRNRIKCCADVTEWRSAKGERLVYRILKDSDTWYRMKMLHKKLDGLIVISTYLKKYYSNKQNVVLVPTLVDSSEEKWNNPHKKTKDTLRLVYAGNPGLKDRLDILISALSKVDRSYVLDIVGVTKEQFLHYFPDYKNTINRKKNIIFHGRVSHQEALEYVKKANYSCFFRENDRVSNSGFPTKLAEALTCGTPVLTNDTSDIAKYINDSNGVLVANCSIHSLTEAIETMPFFKNVELEMFDYHKYLTTIESFLRLNT
ncbi:glycosyltransferase [Ruminococcus flavefaciens]|uniref:glycosyltransferase n=1 Tax=Ruminococcus flavefaciens TaxID=1265 RepID=UPI0004BC9D77|nr:glycosyltransferase [Ruminococcus flavefaciens]